MADVLTRVVLAVLATIPGSERALARAAGISKALLPRIRGGYLRATPATAERLADALDGWAKDCAQGAERLRRAAARSRR
jgi:DNA-binding transcriptional MocR family regulator